MATPFYSIHPGVAYVQSIIENLKVNTGKDLEGWIKEGRRAKLTETKALKTWLKNQGLGDTQAGLVAERTLAGKGHLFDDTSEGYLATANAYVEGMYAVKKTQLKPLYDALLNLGLAIGKEVKACPCQTIVPLYRHHVFAQIKPTTQTRIDFGLALKETPGRGRLVETGGFVKKDRITHRIEVKTLADIDDELKYWLRAAYEMDAKHSGLPYRKSDQSRAS